MCPRNHYQFNFRCKKPPILSNRGSFKGKPSNVLLSLEIQPTIIGAKAFHCPVRNGKEWDHLAMVAWLSLLLKSSTLFNEFFTVNKAWIVCFFDIGLEPRISNKLYGYRIKPNEQLVSVSLTSYNASTPDLSTSWSRTTLYGGFTSGKTYLQASFPLRCFQRLSLPDIATRQCNWHHNRYTSGLSTPVLSY